MKNERVKHLGRRINGLMTCLLIASMLFVVSLCITMFYNLAMRLLEEQCVNSANMLAYALEGYAGAEDRNDMLDALKSRMNCEFTIFEGDVRAYTTIQQNGSRVVGTKLSDELAEIVLKQGQSYVGKADILGVEPKCTYKPDQRPDLCGYFHGRGSGPD